MSYMSPATLEEVVYLPSLSSLEIDIINPNDIKTLIEILLKKKICSQKHKSMFINIPDKDNGDKIQFQYTELFPLENNNNFKILLINQSLIKIQYYESRMPHLRDTFINQIKILQKSIEFFDKILITQIGHKSFFSIRWIPIISTYTPILSTSFITFYQFIFSEESLNKISPFGEIPIIGILPIKLIHSFFFKKYYSNFIYDALLKSTVENVNNIILKNTNEESLDVQIYYKSCSISNIMFI